MQGLQEADSLLTASDMDVGTPAQDRAVVHAQAVRHSTGLGDHHFGRYALGLQERSACVDEIGIAFECVDLYTTPGHGEHLPPAASRSDQHRLAVGKVRVDRLCLPPEEALEVIGVAKVVHVILAFFRVAR